MDQADLPPLLRALAPKSDQLNAEDFLSGPQVFTIKAVKVNPTAPEQPIAVTFEGGFRPWKPCKTTGRAMLRAWGLEDKWVGKSIRLYCDPTVTWGKQAVGGIRILAMSDLKEPLIGFYTKTKGTKAEIRIEVLHPSEIPSGDTLARARNLAKNAKERGWTNEQIKAAMQGKTKIEDMTPEELGRFLRDLQHEPGTISKPDGEETP